MMMSPSWMSLRFFWLQYDDSMFKTTAYNEARASYTSTAMNSEGDPVDKWGYLNNFFKKYNTVADR